MIVIKTKPRAILFDLDGTLADTAPDLAAAMNQVRQAHRLPALSLEVLRPVASAGARGLIGVAFGLQPEDEGYESLRLAFLEQYAAAIAAHSRLFDGITELLNELEQQDLRWGVVTNKAGHLTEVLLPLIGLERAACVVSGDTTPHLKPHPASLLEAARRLELTPEACWYVGDDLRDIQAARAAGMYAIAVGYGYSGAAAPLEWSADHVIQHPLELLSHILA